MKRVILIFLAALSISNPGWCTPQTEQDGSGSFASFGNNKEPTFIKSDSLKLNAKDRIFEYRGNVEVINADLNILSDRLEGKYNEKNDITDLVAYSNVHITKGENVKANGEKAVYSASGQTVVLTENPELLKEGSVLSADKITIYLNEDRSEAEGRVRVKLLNEEKDKGAKGEKKGKL